LVNRDDVIRKDILGEKMKDVIGNILDKENKANEIIEEGKKEKSLLELKMKQDIKKMQDDINTMVAAKLKQLGHKEKEDAEQSHKRIKDTAEKRLLIMEEFYKENRDAWVDTVFNIIIGSEESGS